VATVDAEGIFNHVKLWAIIGNFNIDGRHRRQVTITEDAPQFTLDWRQTRAFGTWLGQVS
jgi:hypothetical protein